MFQASCVLQRNSTFSGIVMDGHLLCSGGTPNPEISERSFLKGERLFLRDRIPFVALRKNGVFKTLPCQEGTRDGRSKVLLIFVFLFLFRELRGQILLSSLLGAFIPHGPFS